MFGNTFLSLKESLCINSALAKVSQLLSPTHLDGTTGRAQACNPVYQWLRQTLLEKLGRKYVSALSNYKVCEWAPSWLICFVPLLPAEDR